MSLHVDPITYKREATDRLHKANFTQPQVDALAEELTSINTHFGTVENKLDQILVILSAKGG